jgi:hypothetical protein
MSKYPGAMRELYPVLPYVPGALAAKALAFIQTSVWLFGTRDE